MLVARPQALLGGASRDVLDRVVRCRLHLLMPPCQNNRRNVSAERCACVFVDPKPRRRVSGSAELSRTLRAGVACQFSQCVNSATPATVAKPSFQRRRQLGRPHVALIIVTRYARQMTKKQSRKRPGRPRTGSAMTAAERMRRMRKRRKAAGLKPVVSWISKESRQESTYSSHRLLEARSLAMHAVIARKIERDPRLLAIASRNVERWNSRWKENAPAWLQEWQQLLKQPWQSIAALITAPDENSARLRQSSPFAGILTNQERWRIYEAFRA
jgi:hypothetical protein